MEKKGGIPLIRASNLILVMNTPKGRGVFSNKEIPAGTVLEVSPVLVLDPVDNEEHVKKTALYNYTYNWPYREPTNSSNSETANRDTKYPATTQAIILGLGSLFNHSSLHQNVGWTRDHQNLLVTYTTLRDIREGEELCISYGNRLTFVDIDAKELRESVASDEDSLSMIQLY